MERYRPVNARERASYYGTAMPMRRDYAEQSNELQDLLGLSAAPLAISFTDELPEGTELYDGVVSEPTEDGRQGTVPAGCVFWMKGTERTFATTKRDHGNCSVGSLTHGFASLDDAAQRSDVGALVEAEWVKPEQFGGIPTVQREYQHLVYGPLADTTIDPDVVFLRLHGKQAMMLHDAWPSLRFEGKPQCHIVPLAKEHGEIAVSVGCMLSRVRTGMSNQEMTCAMPAGQLPELLASLRTSASADRKVAAYAAEDRKRF